MIITQISSFKASLRAIANPSPLWLPNDELLVQLNQASTPTSTFSYSFFGAEIQAMIHGGVTVGNKPKNYYPTVEINSSNADVDFSEE